MKALVRAIVFVITLVVVFVLPLSAANIEDQFGEPEVKMGKEAAAEVAKEQKLSDNAADLKHLREIGDKIAAVANKKEIDALYGRSKITPFEYTFNIIEDDDVNAFSVPGGFIYVYRGLLNFVESDQELAGVIAHEICHASHHHMVFLLQKQAALNNTMAIAMLAMMLGGSRGTDIQNVAMGVQLYQIARLNGYGQQAERDADRGAITYAHESGYNPVGLLTFLERLARRPELVDYGIYRSHPLDASRVKAAKELIQKMGLPINRRDTTKAIKAEVRTAKTDGADVPEVVLGDKMIYRPAQIGEQSAQQRAQETADRINKALDSTIKMHELKADADAATVIVRGQPLLSISEADAKLMGCTPAQAATAATAAIRDVVWKEMVDTIH